MDVDELLKRDGLYYKKFTNVPFSGKTTGKTQRTYKDGKAHGPSLRYHATGQLWWKETYKDGKKID